MNSSSMHSNSTDVSMDRNSMDIVINSYDISMNGESMDITMDGIAWRAPL